ncbi:hypothetical protein [Arthrobacter sedimenti]|uniref:hypothetical protein n=1 Tax=Arthrobacter sedimenti TaxID=2694931 RepID=UPI00112171D1|nr:hypothetical protein [Arthrobacter sedimenti]
MTSTQVEEKHARRALLLLPVATLAGAVLGPLQYLLFYSAPDSLEVTRGIAVMSLIGGAVLGVFIGGVAGVVGYLLAGSRHGVRASALGVTLTVAVVWALILYPDTSSTITVRISDLVIPVCTALAAGLFILTFLRAPNHADARGS